MEMLWMELNSDFSVRPMLVWQFSRTVLQWSVMMLSLIIGGQRQRFQVIRLKMRRKVRWSFHGKADCPWGRIIWRNCQSPGDMCWMTGLQRLWSIIPVYTQMPAKRMTVLWSAGRSAWLLRVWCSLRPVTTWIIRCMTWLPVWKWAAAMTGNRRSGCPQTRFRICSFILTIIQKQYWNICHWMVIRIRLILTKAGPDWKLNRTMKTLPTVFLLIWKWTGEHMNCGIFFQVRHL